MIPAGAVHESKSASPRKSTEGGAVSVIVPVTAPTAQVREVVVALSAELERLGRDYEFILVFDGVRGPAWQDAQKLAAERPGRVQVLGLQQSFG